MTGAGAGGCGVRRLVVCCDGTWNSASRGRPTNVAKLRAAVSATDPDGTEQEAHYVPGVGTAPWERVVGGAFGFGLSDNVLDGYRFLVREFEPDDQLVLVGFSRGAYTARSLAGLVRNAGVLREADEDRVAEAYALYRDDEHGPDDPVALDFRARWSHESGIHAIAVWDTVGSLGIPIGTLDLVRWVNRRYQFHDVTLSSRVANAFHAVAIDERRGAFGPTLWEPPDAAAREAGQRVEQVWFSGVHSDVGGGYEDTGLSDLALLWVADRLASCGLALDEAALRPPRVQPSVGGELHESATGIHAWLPKQPRTLGAVAPAQEHAASAAVARHGQDPAYAEHAANLGDYLAGPDAQVQQVPT